MFSKKLLFIELIFASVILLWFSFSLKLPKQKFNISKNSTVFKLRKCLIHAFDWKLSSQDYIINYRKCINEFTIEFPIAENL